jgi:hypothetical protein
MLTLPDTTSCCIEDAMERDDVGFSEGGEVQNLDGQVTE